MSIMRLFYIIFILILYLSPNILTAQKFGDSYEEVQRKLTKLGFETETSIQDNMMVVTYKYEWFTKKVGIYEVLWAYLFSSDSSGVYTMRGFYSIHPKGAFDEVFKSLKKYKSVGDMEWVNYESKTRFYLEMYSDYIQVTGAPL